MGLDYGPVLFVSPSLLLDVWVEVVVPPLSALLADPARQMLGDVGPVLGPVFEH